MSGSYRVELKTRSDREHAGEDGFHRKGAKSAKKDLRVLRGKSDQTYDASSNRTQLKAQIGTANDFLSNYTFDALDRVTRITQQSQTGGNAVAARRIDL